MKFLLLLLLSASVNATTPPDCHKGQWEIRNKDGTKVDCRDHCVPGEYSVVDGDINKVACQECPDGEFTDDIDVAICTAHSDMPHNCGGNTFKKAATKTNDNKCEEKRECFLWEKMLHDATETADRQCEDCPPDTYARNPNSWECEETFTCLSTQYLHQGHCTALTECAKGHYIVEEHKVTRNRKCDVCPKGYVSNSKNADKCTPCTNGEFQPASGQFECDDGKDCDPGQNKVMAAFHIFDTQCRDCEKGHYSTDGTAARCTRCAAGTYSNVVKTVACTEMPACVSGQFVHSAGSHVTPRICRACLPGYFSIGDNQTSPTSCQQHTVCEIGSYVNVPGTSSTDTTCAACPNGKTTAFANSATVADCKDIPVGLAGSNILLAEVRRIHYGENGNCPADCSTNATTWNGNDVCNSTCKDCAIYWTRGIFDKGDCGDMIVRKYSNAYIPPTLRGERPCATLGGQDFCSCKGGIVEMLHSNTWLAAFSVNKLRCDPFYFKEDYTTAFMTNPTFVNAAKSTVTHPYDPVDPTNCYCTRGPYICGNVGDDCTCHGTVFFGSRDRWVSAAANGVLRCESSSFTVTDTPTNPLCFCAPSEPGTTDNKNLADNAYTTLGNTIIQYDGPDTDMPTDCAQYSNYPVLCVTEKCVYDKNSSAEWQCRTRTGYDECATLTYTQTDADAIAQQSILVEAYIIAALRYQCVHSDSRGGHFPTCIWKKSNKACYRVLPGGVACSTFQTKEECKSAHRQKFNLKEEPTNGEVFRGRKRCMWYNSQTVSERAEALVASSWPNQTNYRCLNAPINLLGDDLTECKKKCVENPLCAHITRKAGDSCTLHGKCDNFNDNANGYTWHRQPEDTSGECVPWQFIGCRKFKNQDKCENTTGCNWLDTLNQCRGKQAIARRI